MRTLVGVATGFSRLPTHAALRDGLSVSDIFGGLCSPFCRLLLLLFDYSIWLSFGFCFHMSGLRISMACEIAQTTHLSALF